MSETTYIHAAIVLHYVLFGNFTPYTLLYNTGYLCIIVYTTKGSFRKSVQVNAGQNTAMADEMPQTLFRPSNDVIKNGGIGSGLRQTRNRVGLLVARARHA